MDKLYPFLVCVYCKELIIMQFYYERPDIDYFGLKFKPTGKYAHGYCIVEDIERRNREIK